jgi:hypothetical protein
MSVIHLKSQAKWPGERPIFRHAIPDACFRTFQRNELGKNPTPSAKIGEK